MIKKLLAFALFLCSAGFSVAEAQSSEAISSCNRAWLASDWATVASDCTDFADSAEAKYVEYKAQAESFPAGAPPDLATGSLQIARANMLFAGEARARTAVAYAKLKRMTAYAEQLEKSRTDISTAYAAATEAGDQQITTRAQTLQQLLASPQFLTQAPGADVLAHI